MLSLCSRKLFPFANDAASPLSPSPRPDAAHHALNSAHNSFIKQDGAADWLFALEWGELPGWGPQLCPGECVLKNGLCELHQLPFPTAEMQTCASGGTWVNHLVQSRVGWWLWFHFKAHLLGLWLWWNWVSWESTCRFPHEREVHSRFQKK